MPSRSKALSPQGPRDSHLSSLYDVPESWLSCSLEHISISLIQAKHGHSRASFVISLNVSKLLTRISKFQFQMLGRQTDWLSLIPTIDPISCGLCVRMDVDVMWPHVHSVGIVGEEADKQANCLTHLLYIFSSLDKDSKSCFSSVAQFLQTKWILSERSDCQV